LEKISKANSLNHSCQAPHTQCVISGGTKVGMDDGIKQQFAPRDVLVVPPRHNAVGNELVVADELAILKDYAMN
jgi:hypothetical protein